MDKTKKTVRASMAADAYAYAKAGAALTGKSIPEWLGDAARSYFREQAIELTNSNSSTGATTPESGRR